MNAHSLDIVLWQPQAEITLLLIQQHNKRTTRKPQILASVGWSSISIRNAGQIPIQRKLNEQQVSVSAKTGPVAGLETQLSSTWKCTQHNRKNELAHLINVSNKMRNQHCRPQLSFAPVLDSSNPNKGMHTTWQCVANHRAQVSMEKFTAQYKNAGQIPIQRKQTVNEYKQGKLAPN